MAKKMWNAGNECMKHKGQHGSCIATRATQWAPGRGQAFSPFILDHQ